MNVFQYGSNVSEERLNSPDRLCGDAIPITAAKTAEGYVLVFDVWSELNQCGSASITRKGDMPVWGRLYDIPEDLIFRSKGRKGRRTLDHIEAEGKNYKRIKILIIRKDTGEKLEALTYVSNASCGPFEPSQRYLNHILAGLEECGVPDEYITQIRHVSCTLS